MSFSWDRSAIWASILSSVVACSAKTGAPVQGMKITDAGSPLHSAHPDARTTFTGVKPPPDAPIIHPGEGGIAVGNLNAAKRIDLLFMVDDSASMADKHEILKAAVPDLLNRFVNPVCLDRFGKTNQPATADAPCPVDMNRQFLPVRDIHIGIVTSSLGVADTASTVCQGSLGSRNDAAHFVGSLPRASAVPTSPGGFLVWDPDQKAMPAGQKDITALIDSFGKLVDVVGQAGCGYESQLEAWYRALVDPEPRLTTKLLPCGSSDAAICPGPSGIDQTVLDQRAAFLRPDSLLIIVMLTDENDCSMRDDAAVLLGSSSTSAPAGSSACKTNPNDSCCYPCSLTAAPPAGCPSPDPVCATMKTLPTAADQPNLRCFDGKRRFGFDPLRPVQRYIDALTKPTVPNRAGAMVQNPIFAGGGRQPSQVFLVGITGVPWQDVATDDTVKSVTDLRLKSAKQLRDQGLWDDMLGDPSAGVAPRDGLLVESLAVRTGVNPVTGDTLQPPTAGLLANPINGHERNISTADDLQYSCIFPLPMSRDCAATSDDCDCSGTTQTQDDNPLCQTPGGTYSTTQRFAKAYPPVRMLQVLKGVGDQGVLTSICPKNITDPGSEDYAYRPVIGTLVQDVAPMLVR